MAERKDIVFPVGRFVSGSLTEKRATDMDNRPIAPEKQRYEFGIAFEKTGPIVPVILDIAAYAKAATPAHAAQIDHWLNTFQGYSMKISDGDRPSSRTGEINPNTAGCYVFWFSTGIEIRVCRLEGNQNIQIPADSVKRGWYFDLTGNVVPNGEHGDRAGVYMNPEWLRLVAEGDEIVGGRSAEDAFGGAGPAALPAGARPLGSGPSTPLPGTTGGLPGAPAGNGLPGSGGPGLAAQQGVPGGTPQQTGLPGAGLPGQTTTASPSSGLPGQPQGQPGSVQHPPHHGVLGGHGLPGSR